MAASTAFQRIQRDTLRLCASILTGKVCTFADLGAVDDQVWLQVAKNRRTEVLMQLEDRGLL